MSNPYLTVWFVFCQKIKVLETNLMDIPSFNI